MNHNTFDIHGITAGPIGDALLRRSTGRMAGHAGDLLEFDHLFQKADPDVLERVALELAAEFHTTARLAEQNSELPQSAQPGDPAIKFRADLRRYYQHKNGHPAKVRQPVEVGFDVDFHPAPGAQGGVRINLSFDGNLSLKDAIVALKEAWQMLKRIQPDRRKPKAVSEATIKLVRFACFESRDMGWAERAARWNRMYPDMQYLKSHDMYKSFVAAEYALLKTQGSLLYYLDKSWRQMVDMESDDLTTRQEMRRNKRMDEHARQTLLNMLSHIDDPALAELAPAGVPPIVWKMDAAAQLCKFIADWGGPDYTEMA